MTISSEVRKAGPYPGNGVADTFPFDFKIFEPEDLLVVLTIDGAELVLEFGDDYGVSLNSDQENSPGGEVVLNTPLPSGQLLTMTSAAKNLQPTKITNQGAFYPEVVNQALDRVTILIQQVDEKVGRSVKVPISSTVTPDDLISQLTNDAASARAAVIDAGQEADRAGQEADRAGQEADRAGQEADRAGQEADRAGQEADRAYEIVKSAKELFEITPHNGPIETIPVGKIGGFGQTWFAATYPEAATALEAGKQFMVTELQWQTGVVGNPDAYKGCWSSGGTDEQGRRWYRAPKLNADTGYRAPFLRGSQIGIDAGKTTDDRIRDITGSFSASAAEGATAASGAFTSTATGLRHTGGDNGGTSYSFAASRVVPTGTENSPRYHGVIMCIRMFGTVSNPGSLDAAQLATDLAVANAKIAALQNDIGFAIIYPNGGTEAAPASISSNQRFVATNPFTNHHVMCEVEIKTTGNWFKPGWSSNNTAAYGVSVGMDGDSIVVQSGINGVTAAGNVTGATAVVSGVATSAQVRVKVRKLKGDAA